MKRITAILLLFCVILTITTWGVVKCRFIKKGEQAVTEIKYFRSLIKDNALNFHINTKRYNKTTMALSGNVTLYNDWDETHQFKYKLYTWGDGGWKFHGMSGTYNYACQMFTTFFNDAWKQVLIATHDTRATKCPMPAGSYAFDDIHIDFTKSPYFYAAGRHLLIFQNVQYNVVLAAAEAEFELKFEPIIPA